MRKHIVLILTLLAAVIVLSILNFTTPTDVGPFGVLIFFIAFYILMFGAAFGLIGLYEKISGKKIRDKRVRYLYAAVIGFSPVLLLLLLSFETLNIVSIILVILFVVLGCFLVKNRFGVVK